MHIYDSKYLCIIISVYLYILGNLHREYVCFQVYVGSKSTMAEGTNFGSTRGAENEVTEMEVCISGN